MKKATKPESKSVASGRVMYALLVWLSTALLGVCVAGCAFEEGQPWGQAEMSLELTFAPPESRLTDEGYLRTTTDYLIQVDVMEITVESMSLLMGAGGGASSFDPADPPEGYSLCHNGHCHADDGSLVDYEDIEAELATGGGGGVTIVQPITVTPLQLSSATVPAPLEACPDDCQLPRGSAVSVSVRIESLYVEGMVYDSREPARIPKEGIPFAGELSVESTVDAGVDAEVGPDEEVGVAINAVLPVTERIFDGIDWSTHAGADFIPIASDAQLSQSMVESLIESSELSVSVNRF